MMKHSFLYILGVMLLTAFCWGCSEEQFSAEGGNGVQVEVPDPKGMEQGDLVVNGEPLRLESFGNMSLDIDFTLSSSWMGVEYCDMGRVKGLGNLSVLPDKGWKKAVTLRPGHGYLLRRQKDKEDYYARIYVTEYLTDNTGTLTGVRINYQSPLQLSLQMEQTEYTYSGDEITRTRLMLPCPTYVQLESAPEWCEVSCGFGYITLRLLENVTAQPYEGEIVLSNSEGSLSLHITQEASSSPSFESGRGTRQDPYRITTAYQLDQIRYWGCRKVKNYFSLENDIDLTTFLADKPEGWEAIGTLAEPFFGSFSGNGYTLSGLWMCTSGENMGLFGYARRSEITGVRLELGDRGMTVGSGGGICGLSIGSMLIHQCSVKGYIKGGGACGILYSALADHTMDDRVVISECCTEGYITGSVARGIFGGSTKNFAVVVENCYTVADLNVRDAKKGTEDNPGANSYGICYTGQCVNCYVANVSNPDKTTDERVGYINGEDFLSPEKVKCENSYFDVDLMYSLFDMEDKQTLYEYQQARKHRRALTTDRMKQKVSYEGWDFENIWQIEEGVSYPTLRCFNK